MSDLSEHVAPGWTTCYETHLKQRRIIRAWGAYRGVEVGSEPRGAPPAPRSHRFEFWQEVDLDALGSGIGKTRLHAELLCDPSYRPLRYTLRVKDARMTIEFGDDRFTAQLPDGSTVTESWQGADFLLAGNMAPQLAVKLRLLAAGGSLPYEGAFFSPESLRIVPYALRGAVPEVRSGFDEVIHLDAGGWMTGIIFPDGEISVRRVDGRLPRWRVGEARAGRGEPPRSYSAPRTPGVDVEEVNILGPAVPLGAAVARPRERGRAFACALFLGGSGAHDRHGFADRVDLGYHELLDRLAAVGVISLRYDKRGAGTTRIGDQVLDFGFEDVLADAQAALTFLRGLPEVRALPLFLIGHSQGGLVALELAAGQSTFAGVVLLATAGRPLDRVLEEQVARQAAETGLDAAEQERRLGRLRELIGAVRDVAQWTPESVPARVYALRHLRRWYAEILARDPLALAGRLRCPVLVAQCDRDVQVSVRDAELLHAAAEAAGVPAELVVLRGCDHLFKRVRGEPGIRAYHDRRRRVSPLLGDTLEAWVRRVAP